MLLLDIENWIGGLSIGIILLGLLLLIIWIWAIVDIVRNPFYSLLMKVIWIIVVIAFPFIGVLLYIIFGRKTRDTTDTSTRTRL